MPAQVGAIARSHASEVRALVGELLPLAEQYVGSQAEAAGWQVPRADVATDALLAYSLSIADAVPSTAMALREFDWRNGWFLRQTAAAGVACPLHLQWLERSGCVLPEMLMRCAQGALPEELYS